MAKRKRLGPAPIPFSDPLYGAGANPKITEAGLRGALVPPIAQIGADTAAHAALAEVSAEMESARASGRLSIDLPVTAIGADHLIRDRVGLDDEALAVLMTSLRERGQQTPIDVTDLGGGRYGLISGYRRLQAIQRLKAGYPEEAQRWSTIRAVLRRPDTAGEAYRAMVEENEIRVGLTYFERARIVAACVEAGIFESNTQALRTLFGTSSRAKRSKIGSFLSIVAALDGALAHPEALPERLGLTLSKALEDDPELGRRLAGRLRALPHPSPGETVITRSADEERAIIESILAPTGRPDRSRPPSSGSPAASGTEKIRLGQDLAMTVRDGRIVLEGTAVDARLRVLLIEWLRAR